MEIAFVGSCLFFAFCWLLFYGYKNNPNASWKYKTFAFVMSLVSFILGVWFFYNLLSFFPPPRNPVRFAMWQVSLIAALGSAFLYGIHWSVPKFNLSRNTEGKILVVLCLLFLLGFLADYLGLAARVSADSALAFWLTVLLIIIVVIYLAIKAAWNKIQNAVNNPGAPTNAPVNPPAGPVNTP